MCIVYSGYLILICALLELFKLSVQHSELPGDTLYSCVESSVLTILCVKVILIALTLLLGANLSVFSAQTYKNLFFKVLSLKIHCMLAQRNQTKHEIHPPIAKLCMVFKKCRDEECLQ